MRIAICTMALALAACGGEAGGEAEETPAPMPVPESSSAPELEELGEADLAQADLAGELACSFRREADAPPIWLGRGDVAENAGAQGAIKLAGTVRTVAMEGTGGYDAMADGARFSDGGIALTIAKAGDEPIEEDPPVAMESPIYPATMTFVVPGEAEQAVQGLLECGP